MSPHSIDATSPLAAVTATGPTLHEQLAARLGLPATVQGCTPNDADYWREPGLPWQPTTSPEHDAVRDRRGMRKIWQYATFASESMAPRFATGTVVAVDAVFTRAELEIGRVYVRRGPADGAGLSALHVGRLVAIGDTFLELALDNHAVGLRWPLRENEQEATWDILEITHYCHCPAY